MTLFLFNIQQDISSKGPDSWGRQRPLGRPAGIIPNLTKQILYYKIVEKSIGYTHLYKEQFSLPKNMKLVFCNLLRKKANGMKIC